MKRETNSRKMVIYLHMCVFCRTFEHLPWLWSLHKILPVKAFLFSRSLESCHRSYVRRSLSKLHSGASSSRSYVRSMQPILQFARLLFEKYGLALWISPSASSYESKLPTSSRETASIDRIYNFSKKGSLHLRMCIFCRTFAGWKENHYGRRYQTNDDLQRR